MVYNYQLDLDRLNQHASEHQLVAFVDKVIAHAIDVKASDIHFEPFEHEYRIRFRIDGLLYLQVVPPLSVAANLTSRLKIMAELNIAERRRPQDGRFKHYLKALDKSIDFRVSTCPTLFGEKIVLRLLDTGVAQRDMADLGLNSQQAKALQAALAKPQGLILVTGPTGSGKTVTLYSALNHLNSETKNISTAEDPIEIHLPGINQVSTHHQIGLDFAQCLRAFLRQDPDIIMVGEIRDLETADVAIKAAQTGHLVLSTLHTNSAVATIMRLSHMGIEPFNLAGALELIVAQRLARKLCPHCKQGYTPPQEIVTVLLNLKTSDTPITLYHADPAGCEHCQKGYQGRVGLFEVLSLTSKIKDLILSAPQPSTQLHNVLAQEGFVTLYQHGVQKVLEGITSLEEVQRVCVR